MTQPLSARSMCVLLHLQMGAHSLPVLQGRRTGGPALGSAVCPSPGLPSQGYTPETFGSRGRGFEPRRVNWEPALSGEQKLDGRAHHCITLGSQGDTRWMRICARACAAPAGLALVAREAVNTTFSLSLSACSWGRS